jgi:hypothetical protein
MKLDDAERYRHVEVNNDLHRVYLGNVLVGQVRRGIDHKWYPELPHEDYKSAALQRVILANEAITSYIEGVSGSR